MGFQAGRPISFSLPDGRDQNIAFPGEWGMPFGMKRISREARQQMCVRKRRYSSQGEALNAAHMVGVERRRKAYLCPLCNRWHLASV